MLVHIKVSTGYELPKRVRQMLSKCLTIIKKRPIQAQNSWKIALLGHFLLLLWSKRVSGQLKAACENPAWNEPDVQIAYLFLSIFTKAAYYPV